MTEKLRVVLYGSGSPMSVAALQTLQARCDLIRIVVPRLPGGLRAFVRKLLHRGGNSLAVAARQLAIPLCSADCAKEHVPLDAPDVICVASFPHLIPPSVVDAAKLGALNLHGSRLPRHRGPDPLFWTYFHGDEETGVTLHWIDSGFDSGDIVSHRSWRLDRGTRVTDVYGRQMMEGCSLLAEAMDALTRGETLPRSAQESERVTQEPSPTRRTWSIDFERWPAERVWHFLHGLAPAHDDLLTDDGRTLRIFPDLELIEGKHAEIVGTLKRQKGSFTLFCKGGMIRGRFIPPAMQVRRRLSRWLSA